MPGKAPLDAEARHKCLQCPDYDLCETCIESQKTAAPKHDKRHLFLRIDDPATANYPTVTNRSALQAAATILHGTAAVIAAQTCPVPWATVHVRRAFGVAAAAHFAPNCHIFAWSVPLRCV